MRWIHGDNKNVQKWIETHEDILIFHEPTEVYNSKSTQYKTLRIKFLIELLYILMKEHNNSYYLFKKFTDVQIQKKFTDLANVKDNYKLIEPDLAMFQNMEMTNPDEIQT